MEKATFLDKLKTGTQAQSLPKMLMTFAVVLLLLLGMACITEAWFVAKEQTAEKRVLDARTQLADEIGALVSQTNKRLTSIAAKPELQVWLSPLNSDPNAFLNAKTAFDAEAKAVGIRAVLYRPDLREMMSGDIAEFGFARGNALAEARASDEGHSRVQVINLRSDDARMAFATVIRHQGIDQALAFVQLPLDVVKQKLAEAAAEGGRLVLNQGESAESTADVFAPEGGRQYSVVTRGLLPVPGTRLWVGAETADYFKPSKVPMFASLEGSTPMGLYGLGAFLIAVGVVVLTARTRLLQRKSVRVNDNEPVMGPMHVGPKAAAELQARLADKAGPTATEAVQASAAATVTVNEAVNGTAVAPVKQGQLLELDRSIFRAYDIRGVVGETLLPETAYAIGQAVGSAALERGLDQIVVARDGRDSGPKLVAELIRGVCASGCHVMDIGAVPTPTLYYATYQLGTGSGVMLTGSHNPANYNGFKIMLGSETLAETQIQDLYGRIVEGRLSHGSGGVQTIDVRDDYVERIVGDIQLDRPLKVAVDAGNGIAGELGVRILQAIGCEVVPMYCDVDGSFPNHHPDPSEPKNLQDLIFAVKQYGADIGLAFDGDGDRLGVVTPKGEIIWPDRVMMLFARDVLSRNPGASIIYDVKCTGRLNNDILSHGGLPIMWKTGHSLIKAKMREEDAALAGEMSGHFFFAERWYGFDDGIYAAARLCEILSMDTRDVDAIFAEIPTGVSTPELKVAMAEGAHYEFVERFREKAKFPGAGISFIDGIRADYPDGWGLLRCSNTTPNLVLRFEADNQVALNRIQAAFRDQIVALDGQLKLPF